MGGWLSATWQVARRMLGMSPAYVFADPTPRPVADVIAAMMGSGPGARVGRLDALSVAAVQRGRNEMCSIATLPLRLYRGLDVVDHPLFRQFDPDRPNVVHLSLTIEDLVFEGVSWWLITGQDFDGYPVSVRHIPADKVSIDPPAPADRRDYPGPAGVDAGGRWVWIDGKRTPAALMIRFDSPNPGLLKANARAIR
ncbi:MAG TPA: hypothetical protein VD864_00855, partial [Nocardioides sp.]|nr:hypothetical protein [Nocardioides sp.]